MEKRESQQGNPQRDEMPEDLLYQYTGKQGLLGILESGTIWATHYLFLNDQSELQEAPALLFDAFDLLRLNHPALPSAYWNGIRGALNHTGMRIASYLASFTEDSEEKGGPSKSMEGVCIQSSWF